MSVTVTVVAPAPPDRVWERWTDFAAWPAWHPHCIEAELDGPMEPGTRLRLHLRDQRGREFYTRPVLTTIEEGREVAWAARGPGLGARTRTALTAEPAGTRTPARLLYTVDADDDHPRLDFAVCRVPTNASWTPSHLRHYVASAL